MVSSLFFIALATSSSLAKSETKSETWGTVETVKVGDKFKFPLIGTELTAVRPLQAAFGARAVEVKRRELAELDADDLKDTMKEERILVVSAPDGNFYIVDHHHQALATYRIGERNAYFKLHADLHRLGSMGEFWARMRANHWVRELDDGGRPIAIPDGLPKSILGMKDDPYRSLAWFVRQSGGYDKTTVEFAEFDWADFFRAQGISMGTTDADFNRAVIEAERLAHGEAARGLPGWRAKRRSCMDWLFPE